MNKTVCCFYPSEIIFVDDDLGFLRAQSLQLRKEHLCKTFSDPRKAIDYLRHLPKSNEFYQDILIRPEETVKDDVQSIDINIKSIYKKIYDKGRFNISTVLIVDYSMPAMNGLEVCEHAPTDIQKILLTGEADEKIAVEAFNKGLINVYIKKDDPNLITNINEAIQQLQKRYFFNASEFILNSLIYKAENPAKHLLAPEYITFIETYRAKSKAVEYYLFDARGSVLFLDKTGDFHLLVLRSQDDMRSAVEIAELADETVAPEIIQALADKTKLLFTGEDDDFKIQPNEWNKYMYPANEITIDNERYYYAYLDNKTLTSILNNDDIVGYKQFLENYY